MSHIAVIDIGKTNAKLALVEPDTLAEVAVVTRPNTVLPGPPWPHFDTEGHWSFLLDGLARFHAVHGISAIVTTTHGACVALLDKDGELAAPILDYEHTGPEALTAEYDALRPDFADTGSPRLGMGLNVGAQLHWQFAQDPSLKERTRTIVTYPQYWGFRLAGVAATDVTSLGCHTDLWNPHAGEFSSLVDRLGIAGKIAPAHRSGDVLGAIRPDIAARTGNAPDTPVYCGIHDSNASLLPHILAHAPPFSVVSSGTWTIAMAIGGRPMPLDPAKDTLINVNALGHPVPSARFMGGREHDLVMAGNTAEPTEADLRKLLDGGAMLMPSVMPTAGPFRGQTAHWIGQEPETGTGARSAAVAFYLALVTTHCLELIGHRGQIVVEGPFSRNLPYRRMLRVSTGRDVVAMNSATGTSQGAALVLGGTIRDKGRKAAQSPEIDPLAAEMSAYRDTWNAALAKVDRSRPSQ